MKISVAVTQTVEVTLDETKFTPEFMADFREHFYPLHSTAAHAKHLAQLFARGLDREFIEGYGPAKDFGISFELVDGYEEIV